MQMVLFTTKPLGCEAGSHLEGALGKELMGNNQKCLLQLVND